MTAPRTSAPTGRLTRVTLVGPRRRADLVLPSDEPLGTLLPEIVAMVGMGPSRKPRGYQLSMLGGRVLEPTANLRGAGVTDGTQLRVDPLTEAPPAAIVHDVSDEVSDDLGRRRGRWGDEARRWTATATVTASALLAVLLAEPYLPVAALAVTGAVLLVAGMAVAMLAMVPSGVAVLLAGATVLLTTVPAWTGSVPGRAGLAVLGVALTIAALGLATGNRRAGVFGATALLVLLGAWAALLGFGLPAAHTAAVMGIVSVALLGLLPRLAMIASGLTKLDDRQTDELPVARVAVNAAVDSAHRALALACVATAVSGAVAGWVLAQASDGWALALACLVGVALFLRLRAYPLTIEVVALVAAGLAVATGLVTRWTQSEPHLWWGGAGVALAAAALGVVVLTYRPPVYIRARARQLADRLEGLAVVALVPVAVGVFDVYSRLLDTF
jgi:type VII secretion integral membrane protein EccD